MCRPVTGPEKLCTSHLQKTPNNILHSWSHCVLYENNTFNLYKHIIICNVTLSVTILYVYILLPNLECRRFSFACFPLISLGRGALCCFRKTVRKYTRICNGRIDISADANCL